MRLAEREPRCERTEIGVGERDVDVGSLALDRGLDLETAAVALLDEQTTFGADSRGAAERVMGQLEVEVAQREMGRAIRAMARESQLAVLDRERGQCLRHGAQVDRGARQRYRQRGIGLRGPALEQAREGRRLPDAVGALLGVDPQPAHVDAARERFASQQAARGERDPDAVGGEFGRLARPGGAEALDLDPYAPAEVGPHRVDLDGAQFRAESPHDLFPQALGTEAARDRDTRHYGGQHQQRAGAGRSRRTEPPAGARGGWRRGEPDAPRPPAARCARCASALAGRRTQARGRPHADRVRLGLHLGVASPRSLARGIRPVRE